MENILNKQFVNLKETVEDILQYKRKGQGIELKQSMAALIFIALKHSNREVKRSIKSGRDELHSEKSKVDLSRLQLQNLLYEVSHLKKEIVRCQKFKSRDCYLELLTDKEYANKLSVNIEQKPTLSNHKTHLYRLECELKLRKELDDQYSALLALKQELLQENLNQTQRYLSFAPALRTLLESTKPLHDALQLSLDVEWKISSIVKYLPRALYILFINLESLHRASNNFIFSSEVVGFESDVQMQEYLLETSDLPKERRSFTEKNNIPETASDRVLENVLKPHRLHIRLMETPDKSYELVLLIRYWGLLKCATVRAELSSTNNSNIQVDSNSLQDLFDHLYPNDLGNNISIPGIQYELQNLEIIEEKCLEYLVQHGYGKPYCWLQSMCSIPTISKNKVLNHEINLQKWTADVFARISKRWHSWLNLTQQIRGLTHKDIDLYALKENIYPSGLSCSLVQWTAISNEEFNAQNSAFLSNLTSVNRLTYTSYRAVFVRGSAKMECFIRIPSNYPIENPLWIISVHWNGRHTAINNSAIKMMEYWTNSLLPNFGQNNRLLYTQLFRTIYSFDIFLETEGSMQTTREYTKEKPYLNAFSKRIRLRPYRYVVKGSMHAFKQ
ncbi:hypothetical protein KR222_003228 [Zaprionus bogoriensis]|nr:hypothetical protein KR222_003228 [Zaprionus bogoriensis]